jgi:hypothetical protein
MGFSVDANALSGLPTLLDRLGDDARHARSYLLAHSDLRAGEGAINLLFGGHRRAVAQVDTFFEKLAPVAANSAVRVRTAVDYYRRTDRKAAAAFDSSLPHKALPADVQAQVTAHRRDFNDAGDPTTELRSPPDYSHQYPYDPQWLDHFSLVGLARDAIWEITSLGTRLGVCDRPHDVFVECAQPFTGDWAGLRACADVFEHLGEALSLMSSNVQVGATSAREVWNGNAADGCTELLSSIQAALAYSRPPLNTLAKEYRDTAEQAHRLAHAMGAILSELVDLAAMALIEAAGFTATAGTGVGAVAFGAALAVDIAMILEKLVHARAIVLSVMHVVQAADAALSGFAIISPGSPLPDLPTTLPLLPF